MAQSLADLFPSPVRAPRDAAREEELARVLAARRREAESREAQEQEVYTLVERVQKAREDVEAAVQRLQTVSLEMLTYSRRNPGETTASYSVFSNAHLRVCGALTQGLRRTASMDRVLDRAKAERDLARRREAEDQQRQQRWEHQRAVNKLTLPVPDADAFDELYGDLYDDGGLDA